MRGWTEKPHPESLSASLGNVRAYGILVIGLFVAAAIYWGNMVPLDRVVSARGYVMAGGPVVQIQSAQDSRVKTVLVGKGDRVTTGQTLIQMDATRQQMRLDHARRLKAQLDLERLQIRALLEDAAEVLIDPALLSEIDALGMTAFLEDIRHTVRLTAAQRASRSSKSGLAKRMAALNASILTQNQIIANARLDLQLATITSPVAGFVQNTQVLSPGVAVSHQDVLIMIVPIGHVSEVAVDVPTDLAGRLRPGDTADVIVSLTPTMSTAPIPATVDRIIPNFDATKDRRTEAVLSLDPDALARVLRDLPDVAELQPGLHADVRIRAQPQTLFGYLASPFRNLTQRAFRD